MDEDDDGQMAETPDGEDGGKPKKPKKPKKIIRYILREAPALSNHLAVSWWKVELTRPRF
jgi:hypothetical protein